MDKEKFSREKAEKELTDEKVEKAIMGIADILMKAGRLKRRVTEHYYDDGPDETAEKPEKNGSKPKPQNKGSKPIEQGDTDSKPELQDNDTVPSRTFVESYKKLVDLKERGVGLLKEFFERTKEKPERQAKTEKEEEPKEEETKKAFISIVKAIVWDGIQKARTMGAKDVKKRKKRLFGKGKIYALDLAGNRVKIENPEGEGYIWVPREGPGMEKAQVKGFTRVRRGRMEKVSPYERMREHAPWAGHFERTGPFQLLNEFEKNKQEIWNDIEDRKLRGPVAGVGGPGGLENAVRDFSENVKNENFDSALHNLETMKEWNVDYVVPSKLQDIVVEQGLKQRGAPREIVKLSQLEEPKMDYKDKWTKIKAILKQRTINGELKTIRDVNRASEELRKLTPEELDAEHEKQQHSKQTFESHSVK